MGSTGAYKNTGNPFLEGVDKKKYSDVVTRMQTDENLRAAFNATLANGTAEQFRNFINSNPVPSNAEVNQEKVLNTINKAAFKSQGAGTGHWTLEIEGIGGASILDETQSGAGGYGRYRTYSVQTWGADFKNIGSTQYADTLNEAKELARRKLRGTVM